MFTNFNQLLIYEYFNPIKHDAQLIRNDEILKITCFCKCMHQNQFE